MLMLLSSQLNCCVVSHAISHQALVISDDVQTADKQIRSDACVPGNAAD